MDQKEKQALAQALGAHTPRQAQPTIPWEEMERYPCSVQAVEVPAAGEMPVTVYLTCSRRIQPGGGTGGSGTLGGPAGHQ